MPRRLFATGAETVAESLHLVDVVVQVAASRIPDQVDLAQRRIDAQVEAAGLAAEELLQEPDAGGAMNALDVEAEAYQLR